MRTATALLSIALCAAVLGATPALERELLDVPSVQGALETSAFLDRRAHYAGTPEDRFVAQWMRDRLAAEGFEARIEPFEAEVYTPHRLVLQLLASPRVDLDLREAPIAADPDGTRPDAGLPFNAGSGDGSVTAAAVDAGHGLDADYAALAARGASVRGAIALIRYGREFRGDLARRAQENGAAGVIFFVDPADEPRGARYPDGPNRPLGAVQRGSLGLPALRIPVLPISAANASRLLADMRDGSTRDAVHLEVVLDRRVTTLWNTVGTIPGSDPGESVLLGAHRDAWVYGVTDNGSGIAVLVEVARALGYMHRSGWQPQRSITIVGFDGEEIGEAGSKAYVRAHEAELRAGAIAYVNADEATTGQRFGASAAAALAGAVVEASKRVRDPHTDRQSLYDRWRAQPGAVAVGAPGGGSDHESFLFDLGIPTLDVGFSGAFGTYHSSFDDLQYARRFADSGFVNHRAVAQMLALLAMRAADQTVLPYRFAAYVPAMRASLKSLAGSRDPRELAAAMRAVGRFAPVAAAFDAHPDPRRNAAALAAARRLDLILYGRRGYAALPFPDLGQAAAALDGVTALLR